MDSFIQLTDAEWSTIAPLLPPERGRSCRPALDNRRFVNGMLWIVRTGLPWRDLPAEYGKWNSVYQRYRRWSMSGVWDGLLRELSRIGFFDCTVAPDRVSHPRVADRNEMATTAQVVETRPPHAREISPRPVDAAIASGSMRWRQLVSSGSR